MSFAESLSYSKSRGEHEIVIEKSRFICHIQRAVSEEEAQAFIQSIKNNIGMPHIIVQPISLVNMT